MEKLILGKAKDKELSISTNILQRHFACFGSSGSGKTVACKVLVEELARNGIPIIAFDPQGDIASLVEIEDEDKIKKAGTSPEIRNSYLQNTEVIIWTPGSSKGLPLSINPLQFEGLEEMDAEDKIRFLSATAKNLVSLIGFDNSTDEGKSAESILTVVFEYCINTNISLRGFKNLIELLSDLPESVATIIETISSEKLLKLLIKKLSLLTLGSRRLIFETGVPANIDVLLGLDEPNGKTRISIIYLNTLHTQEEKEFFVANITQMLYNWMLKHPLSEGQEGIQCAYYIDEIAPYIPPVKKPACKDSLTLLFKQARKYGVGCIIATQNPGDIDYKSIAQVSTYNIGTLSTKQDIKKVKTRLDSMAPLEADNIIKKIPSLKKGNFLLLSPDEFDKVQELKVRWLVTKHNVLSEEQLSQFIPEEIREKYKKTEKPSETEEIKETKEAEKAEIEEEKEKPEKTSTKGVDEVLYVRNQIFEKDLLKIIKPHLAGTIIKSEILTDRKFSYLPLLKVNLTFYKKKGVFKKKIEEIPENLYLNYETREILYFEYTSMAFSSLLDMDPNKIEDLDQHYEIESIPKSEIDFDFRSLGKKIDEKEIRNNMERKYPVKVNSIELLLIPTWECTIKKKKSDEARKIVFDGVLGWEVIIN